MTAPEKMPVSARLGSSHPDWRERAGDVPTGTGQGCGQAGVHVAGISVRRMDSTARTFKPLAPCCLGPHPRSTIRRVPARGKSPHGAPGTVMETDLLWGLGRWRGQVEWLWGCMTSRGSLTSKMRQSSQVPTGGRHLWSLDACFSQRAGLD